MTGKSLRERWKGKEIRNFCFATIFLYLIVSAVIQGINMLQGAGGLAPLGKGLWQIVISRDALITDYFELAGYSAAFFNGFLVLCIGYWLLWLEKVPFTGLTLAAFFINAGYAFWGKNPLNILPILFGTWLYAKVHKARLSRYIYTALFGTSLAPLVTELVFMLPFDWRVNLLIAALAGIFVGFTVPPLSMHTASMHMGYNLYNVGFATGILAFVLVCCLKSLGLESTSVLIWREGRPLWLGIGLCGYFALAFCYGLYIEHWQIARLLKIWKHPGRAVADFVMMDGPGVTLMNMGSVGLLCTLYIVMIGGDFSGPVVGAILTAFGFSAFGAHLKNYLPVLVGVALSALLPKYELTTPGIQLAAMFSVGLAPIAGQFGPIAGIFAGLLHATIVMCTSSLYGGLNLYNNGFSAGWVAIVMVPVVESFMTRFGERKRRKKHDA